MCVGERKGVSERETVRDTEISGRDGSQSSVDVLPALPRCMAGSKRAEKETAERRGEAECTGIWHIKPWMLHLFGVSEPEEMLLVSKLLAIPAAPPSPSPHSSWVAA